jgi:hypothetical protein
MTPYLDPAGPAEAGEELVRVDAVLSDTGETHRLEIGLGVAVKHALLTEPVPPLHVVHRNVTAISGPGTPAELLKEIRVDAGHGTWAAHAVLPGPGGAS